jgi:hypothetical protein
LIFGFLSLAYFTKHYDLQFHPFSCKWHNFIFLYGCVILYSVCVCTSYFLYPLTGCWAVWLIPQFSCCEQSCNKHGYSGISLVYWFALLWIYAQEWYSGGWGWS